MGTKEQALKNLEKLYDGHEITLTAYYFLQATIHQLEIVPAIKTKEKE